jgi:broad specificity phosphatase PhoE
MEATPTMKRLILVRHGETVWNARKILQGQSDIDLSERGIAQAKALKRAVDRFEPDTAIVSDLVRATHTAQILGWGKAAPDANWREADLGQWTGHDAKELIAQHPVQYQAWRDGKDAPPGGESFADFKARIAKAVSALQSLHGNVLVVTHGGVVRAALSHLIGLHPDRIVAVNPASATVLDMSNTPRLAAYNITGYSDLTETSD